MVRSPVPPYREALWLEYTLTALLAPLRQVASLADVDEDVEMLFLEDTPAMEVPASLLYSSVARVMREYPGTLARQNVPASLPPPTVTLTHTRPQASLRRCCTAPACATWACSR